MQASHCKHLNIVLWSPLVLSTSLFESNWLSQSSLNKIWDAEYELGYARHLPVFPSSRDIFVFMIVQQVCLVNNCVLG
jgi:hypothetical protein